MHNSNNLIALDGQTTTQFRDAIQAVAHLARQQGSETVEKRFFQSYNNLVNGTVAKKHKDAIDEKNLEVLNSRIELKSAFINMINKEIPKAAPYKQIYQQCKQCAKQLLEGKSLEGGCNG